MIRYIQTILFLCILISCNEKGRKLPYYDTADFTPKWKMPDKDNFHRIRNFSLIDQEGKSFTAKDLDGKITVADFFFTICPGICPKMAASMEGIQNEFIDDKDVQLISHSVMPNKDSVPVLNAYAAKKNVQYKKWKLLTGEKAEIYDLGRKYYYVEEDLGVNSDTSIFLHTENFVLIDKNRHIRGIYNGLDPSSMQALKTDIFALKEE